MSAKKKTDFVLRNPFSQVFLDTAWKEWKDFKKEQFYFTYKPRGEQAAIDDLFEISGGNEGYARKIIKHAIAKGWKGLFEIKTLPNETFKGNTQKPNPGGDVTPGGFGQL